MISGDMSVTEFFTALWGNKIKIGLLILAVIFGPGLYDDWQKKRGAERLHARGLPPPSRGVLRQAALPLRRTVRRGTL